MVPSCNSNDVNAEVVIVLEGVCVANAFLSLSDCCCGSNYCLCWYYQLLFLLLLLMALFLMVFSCCCCYVLSFCCYFAKLLQFVAVVFNAFFVGFCAGVGADIY